MIPVNVINSLPDCVTNSSRTGQIVLTPFECGKNKQPFVWIKIPFPQINYSMTVKKC